MAILDHINLPSTSFLFEPEALLALLLTVLVYFVARFFYLKSHCSPFAQPLLISTPLIIIFIDTSPISLNDYLAGTSILTWMIAPLTVALMIPLASNMKEIKRLFPAILFTLLVCGFITVVVTLMIAYLLGASDISLLSLSTKSVTTPVTLLISGKINSLPSLAALIVLITGVLGVVIAPFAFKLSGTHDERGQGLALGLSAHVIGTTYALEKNQRIASYSVISMSITALISAVLIPLFISAV